MPILKEKKLRQDPSGNWKFKNNNGGEYAMVFAKFDNEQEDRSMYIPLDGKFARPELLQTVKEWQIGQEVPVELYTSDQGYQNFKLLSKTELRFRELEGRLAKLEAQQAPVSQGSREEQAAQSAAYHPDGEPKLPPYEDIPVIDQEVKLEDIPF